MKGMFKVEWRASGRDGQGHGRSVPLEKKYGKVDCYIGRKE